MTQIITSKGEWLLIECLQGSHSFSVDKYGDLRYIEKKRRNEVQRIVSLPECAEWSFLCTTETITEDIAKGIVPSKDTLFDGIVYPHYP